MSDLQTLVRALPIPSHRGNHQHRRHPHKTGHKAGKGRLVRTYLITGKARREAVDSRCDLLGHRATMDAQEQSGSPAVVTSNRNPGSLTTTPEQEASSG